MGCDNLTNGTSPRTLPYTFQTSAPLTILVGILILLTVFGNVLVVIAVFTSRSLKAPQNLFLVSLASADILVATLVIPFSLANELMGFWYFGKVWCEIYQALDVLFCTSSIVHLCAISLDRYWSVTQAVEYNLKRTPKRIKCIIFVVWVIAAVISFPPLIPMEGTKDEDLTCEMNEEKWYIISSCIGSFFAPCIIMILVYVRIYQIAKGRARAPLGKKTNGEAGDKRNSLGPPRKGHGEKLERDRGAGAGEVNGMDMEDSSSSDQNVRNPCSPKLKKGKRKGKPGPSKPEDDAPRCGTSMWKGRQNREKRFTFVLAVVIGVFVVCWFPFFFTYTLTAVCDSCCVPKTVFKFFFWFGYCNSCLNPVIYTIFNNDFRRAFKKILCKGERKEII